ncbi:hypothetical protein KC19_9G015500 [Ceratodon purpureus]|uniref:Uncharacterized protein n=1 Tax=Ceratodon purpureus TaxID=3225 RepID=A0A8T0GMP8_CERPU|nr:hypothetical protein KC19_9G015500 [Ceratodon purpureus]
MSHLEENDDDEEWIVKNWFVALARCMHAELPRHQGGLRRPTIQPDCPATPTHGVPGWLSNSLLELQGVYKPHGISYLSWSAPAPAPAPSIHTSWIGPDSIRGAPQAGLHVTRQ